jgi:hypothetical protein
MTMEAMTMTVAPLDWTLPRSVPSLQVEACDVNSLSAIDVCAQTLKLGSATSDTASAGQTNVASQLTTESLATESLTASSLTCTGSVSVTNRIVAAGNYVGPQLFTISSNSNFAVPSNSASSCTVYFPTTLPAGCSCTLPVAPPTGFYLYVANAAVGPGGNTVTVYAPSGTTIVDVSAPAIILTLFVVTSARQRTFLWTGAQWVVSAQ